MAKQKPEVIERYGNEAEANASKDVNGLVSRPGHEKQPKWVAEKGKVDGSTLGKKDNYTHKMTFKTKPGTIEWLKQFEDKPTNEPNRYAVPAKELENFNKRVINVEIEKIRKK
jgi:hypothetical protein